MLRKIVALFLSLIYVIPLVMFLSWCFMSEKKLNILILDKTVLDTKAQQHISLSWLLTNEKYSHSKTGAYNNKIDYFGFFPKDNGLFQIRDFNGFSRNKLDSLVQAYNVVYYTELYGIYDGWSKKQKNGLSLDRLNISNLMEHKRKIYGGMTQNEFLLLKKMKQKKKLIITEFNIIESPTSNQIRFEFEREFNLCLTGWIGHYYESLDTLKNKEIPKWLKQNYLKDHSGNWPFNKSGIVFINDNGHIEILENKTHLITEFPTINTSKEYVEKYDLPTNLKYLYWFDIINTTSKNKIVSTYKICANSLGKKLMHQYGIPETFPAVIEHDSTDYRFYYFSGNFCDNPICLSSAKFRWIDCFVRTVPYKKDVVDRVSFFWNFYRPLLKTILSKN